MDQNLRPEVTVIMPVFNAAPFVGRAIESILNQTYKDFELLILNDGSTDNSLQIIKSFHDERIKLINNEANIGIIKTRNKGLALSTGKYIAMMDADDISLPSRLQKQVDFLNEHLNVAVLATKLILIDENGEEQGYWPEDYNTSTVEQIKNMLPESNCIGQPTVMMRADIVKPIGYANFLHNEDWGLWLDLISKGYTIAKLNEILLQYRVHTNSTTVTANTKGIEKKIIRFKSAYLKERIFNFKKTDYKVLSSLAKDLIKYIAPTLYKIITKLYDVNPVKLIAQYIKVSRQLASIQYPPVSHLFFFPYYHTGGAEKVHASILETVSDKKPIVFITGKSNGNAFLEEFKKHATVMEVNLLINIGPFNRWVTKKIKSICEKNTNVVLFGCNSLFFYRTLPLLSKQVKCIDLIHAFVHIFEDGPEKWSLPVVPLLEKRVVISGNTKYDFEKLYRKNNIDIRYLDRIVCIPNFVELKTHTRKEIENTINILYVGRGSDEKRLYLISRAARLASLEKLPVFFHFIGDVKDAIPAEDLPYCNLHGEITDAEMIDTHYKNAHVLLITSSREGFPMVIMEAMMHGVVAISTNVGGISEHVKNFETGILIEQTDETEIVYEILNAIRYFSENKSEWKRISENAFQYATANFNKEAFFQSYKKLLN